jgi:riboflavin synthase
MYSAPVFTGIVERMGRILEGESDSFRRVLRVDVGAWTHRPEAGESIAVGGCCLTTVRTEEGDDGGVVLRFDVMRQTLETTTLGGLRPDDRVNLEHAVSPQTLLGGHVVQGHIDGLGRVAGVVRDETQWRIRIAPPESLMSVIVPKGSIAVDGVSLTIAEVGDGTFDVALIPETLERTTLSQLREGDDVNLEGDYLAKIVVNWLEQQRGGQ